MSFLLTLMTLFSNDQQTHEKMLRVTCHQGNAHKTRRDFTYSSKNGYHRKIKIKNANENVENKVP